MLKNIRSTALKNSYFGEILYIDKKAISIFHLKMLIFAKNTFNVTT